MNISSSRNHIYLCPLLILLWIPILDSKGASYRTIPTARPSTADLFKDFEKSVDTRLPEWMHSKVELVYANKIHRDKDHMIAMLVARQEPYVQRFKKDVEKYDNAVERSLREDRSNLVVILLLLAGLCILLLRHMILVVRRKNVRMARGGEGITMNIEGLSRRGHSRTTVTLQGHKTLITTRMGVGTTVTMSGDPSSVTVRNFNANLVFIPSEIPQGTAVVQSVENRRSSRISVHAHQDCDMPPAYETVQYELPPPDYNTAITTNSHGKP